jgi:hypothetical protein
MLCTLYFYTSVTEKKSLKITKGIIRNCQSMKTDNTMTKRKMTSNDLLNTTQKTNYRATLTPLISRGELMCSVTTSCEMTRASCDVEIVLDPSINKEKQISQIKHEP